MALGFGLLSRDMPWAKKVFNWVRPRVTKAMKWAQRRWRLAPVPLRVVAVVVAAGLGSLAGYGSYKVLFG